MTMSPTITDDMIRRLQGLNRAVASDLWRLYRDADRLGREPIRTTLCGLGGSYVGNPR